MFIKPTINSKAELTAFPFMLAEAKNIGPGEHQVKRGFQKVLAGGNVVRLCESKPLPDRLLGDGITNTLNSQKASEKFASQIILEAVVTNLEAGIRLMDRQELVLAKIGGRLSEMALTLNQVRNSEANHCKAQKHFEVSRSKYRSFLKETFGHTALFSSGVSDPIIVAVPKKHYWEVLSIERCNIESPGLRSIEVGKVSPSADGLLLDPQSFSSAFQEWRRLCANNRLQWHLFIHHLSLISDKLHRVTKGQLITIPTFPKNLQTLRSIHSFVRN